MLQNVTSPFSLFEIPEYPDTLSFCDDEIKGLCEGKTCPMEWPLLMQLIKELRLLREELAKRRTD